MKIKFVFPADDELEEAISYYNIQEVGLGDNFFGEVKNAIRKNLVHLVILSNILLSV